MCHIIVIQTCGACGSGVFFSFLRRRIPLVFFFRYSSEEEVERMLPHVIARLSGPDLYSQLVFADMDYRAPKSTRDKFALAIEASYLLMVAGAYENDLSSVLEQLRQRVK